MTAGQLALEWGVKESFVAYVEALPDGRIEARDGAARREAVFVLPGQRAHSGSFSFAGTLHFEGHHGVLDVTLDQFRVDRSGESAVVSAEISGARVPLAVLTALEDGDDVVLHSASVTMTDDGAAVLGGVYSAGTLMSPLTIRTVS